MPTLIIGLGGTGTKVVRRIRKRWDTVGAPRNTALAVIDARSRDPEEGPIDGVFFNPVRPIKYPDAFRQAKEEVKAWWPHSRGVTADPDIDFSNGCGAVRTNGRFFAYWYSRVIAKTIDDAFLHLSAKGLPGTGEDAHTFDVFLVGSLGNGTGGGTFLDVATIVRHKIAPRCMNLRLMGVFIPASVTREKWRGSQVEQRIAAAGYAALIETQYELNRRSRDRLRPREPYVFRGWTDVGHVDFSTSPGRPDPDLPPLDHVFILDKRDTNHLVAPYLTLLDIAAEGISLIAEGADADARLLDGFVHVPKYLGIGSFGAIRLTVPAREIQSHVANVQAWRAVEAARARGPQALAPWRHLLREETPDGTEVFQKDDASLEDHVDFFLGKVLRVREAGEFNQVLERFGNFNKELLDQFNRIIAGVDALTDAKAIANKATEIKNFIDDRLVGLADARSRVLQETWERLPRDPEKPVDAGVQWWINRKVQNFAQAGAFGLLTDWLEEMKKAIQVQRESLARNERKKFLANSGHRDIDLGRTAEDLRKVAEQYFAWFKKGWMKEQIGKMSAEARKKVEYLLWEANIVAAERFFDRILAHLDTLWKGSSQALEFLSHPRLAQRLEDDAHKGIGAAAGGKAREHQGLKAEYLMGTDESTLDRILSDVEATSEASAVGILGGMGSQNRALLLESLGEDSRVLIGAETKGRRARRDPVGLVDEYRKALLHQTTERVRDRVGSRCRIDLILEQEAIQSLNEYFRLVHQEKDAPDTTPRTRFLSELKDQIGSPATDQIQRQDWQNDLETAMQQAVDYYIAGRLHRLIALAATQWSLVSDRERLAEIVDFSFVMHHGSASRIPQAIQKIEEMGLADQRSNFRTQQNDLMDPRRVDILKVQLGGSVESLEMLEEIDSYRLVMREQPDFSPHLTEQYLQMGRRWNEQMAGGEQYHGAALLALAVHFGLVQVDSSGNYKIARDFSYRDGDKAIQYAANRILGKGIEAVSRDLDGTEEWYVTFNKALRQNLFSLVKDRAIGVPGTPGIGWNGAADELRKVAAEIDRKVQGEPDTSKVELMQRQIRQLNQAAAELEEMKGSGLPALFR
ncbi:MAG TPA: tubulin-like doman-containing protein [Myxococcota bacterium]|nr:tubulin-like doman-containing protein [Myxococcota bacterium]HQK50060.1 tubulin-like doman-containing protein [Myxococcota bacterium]